MLTKNERKIVDNAFDSLIDGITTKIVLLLGDSNFSLAKLEEEGKELGLRFHSTLDALTEDDNQKNKIN